LTSESVAERRNFLTQVDFKKATKDR